MNLIRKIIITLAIWAVNDFIIDCEITWDLIESPYFKRDLLQTLNILETIRDKKRIS